MYVLRVDTAAQDPVEYHVVFHGSLQPYVLAEKQSGRGWKHLNQLRQSEVRLLCDSRPGICPANGDPAMTWEKFETTYPLQESFHDKQAHFRHLVPKWCL